MKAEQNNATASWPFAAPEVPFFLSTSTSTSTLVGLVGPRRTLSDFVGLFVGLAFFALAAPLAAVLGLPHTMDWARLLSTPEGVDSLQAALAEERAP